MKTILAITIMAILVTGVIAPAFQDAFALKSDISKKLPPKAFGEKTKSKSFSKESTHKSGFESVKKEDAKTLKKISAELKAKEILKKLYRM